MPSPERPAAAPGPVAATIALLGTFGTAVAVQQLAGPGIDVVVLGVFLALTLSRALPRWPEPGPHRARQVAGLLAVPPVTGLVAAGVGSAMVHLPWVGATLFVAVVSGAVWVRRFGPRATRWGTLVTLPFVAVLVVPAPAVPSAHGGGHLLWSALIALAAVGWVAAARAVVGRWWPGPVVLGRPMPPRAASEPRPASGRRLPASTRMALQMGAALALAFVVGHLVFAVHWPWVVITAYVVASGNHGRGDVLHKGAHRLVGAAVGTVAATLVGGRAGAGDAWLVVLILVVLVAATWLREVGYAYWAGAVTICLSLLYAFVGQAGSTASLLVDRLAAVAVGAAIASACAWWLLPVRTSDVLRRRIADVLAALGDALAHPGPPGTATQAEPAEPDVAAPARLAVAFDDLRRAAATARATPAAVRRRTGRAGLLVDAAVSLLAARGAATEVLRAAPAELPPGTVGGLRREVGAARRALAGREEPGAHPPVGRTTARSRGGSVEPEPGAADAAERLLRSVTADLRAWRAGATGR